MKKYLFFTSAVLLVLSTLTGCAGQGRAQAAGIPDRSAGSQIPLSVGNELPDDSFTSGEYEKLRALRFDGYEEMSVAEFREKVGTATDTTEYGDLFERLPESKLYELRDTDETAAFLFYTLMPLNADRWQTKAFSGAVTVHSEDSTVLEYITTLTIVDEKALTVREYNDARIGIADGLQTFLNGRSVTELHDNTIMEAAIRDEVQRLIQLWGNENLKVEIEYVFRTEDSFQKEAPNAGSTPNTDTETRRAEYGTEEDYRSLLALKTADYENMSIADFNAKLLAWMDEDFDRMGRVDSDTQWDDFQVDLSEEERQFVRLTVYLSGTENGEFVQSSYTNEAEADPVYGQSLPQKLERNGKQPIWCDLYYQFSYHIADKENVTVGERDRLVGGMVNAIQKFWDETTLDELLTMTEGDIISKLASLAVEYSSNGVTITINAERVHFEHTEERTEM